ncbi:MAG: hypothetical protein HY288_16700 [Planctomycetia bacterium]|nr:hypothetical protein [Planctomycetia bacterium]
MSEPPERQTEPLPDAAEFIAEEIVSEEPIDAELVEGDDESRSSAFHQEEKERTVRKRRRRRRGGRRSKSGRAFDEEQPRDAAGDAPEAASVAEDAGAEEGVSASAPTIEDRTGRPKRRRRRGSGRNRDKARAQTAEPKAGLETEAEHEGKPFADDDEQADLAAVASEADSFEDEGAESQADKNSHRAIPAWEEAIGYIVSVNMENRAKNPKSGAPRGRGRGRGNRGNPRGDNHRRSS